MGFCSSSRIVRARQTKIPAFQAKLPAARNCSAVARSGFSRNWITRWTGIPPRVSRSWPRSM